MKYADEMTGWQDGSDHRPVVAATTADRSVSARVARRYPNTVTGVHQVENKADDEHHGEARRRLRVELRSDQ